MMPGQAYFKTRLEHIPRSRMAESKARNVSKALGNRCHQFSNQLPQFTFPPEVYENPHLPHLTPPAIIILKYPFCFDR